MSVDDLLTLEIATPLGLALQTECSSVAAPSVRGEFGVFPGHLPLLAALRSGVIKYKVGNQDLMAAVGPGFVEAGPERVLLLTDAFALPDDVDVDAVRDELTDAELRLKALTTEYAGAEYEEIVRDLQWAEARLELHAAS
ncbi:MAG TPA: ATP synthase F1 subunit epsilon [Polyangiaceae bacterium]|nr:ATP synthase F1 subunit epsilon [Polyangiaceae bacterium]